MTDLTTAHILDNIPFNPDIAGLMKRLRLKEGSKHEKEFCRLVDEARVLARPRGLYLQAFITDRGEDWVVIDGRRFTSRVLRVNVDQAYRVFPFLATCGQELQSWAEGFGDMLLHFWAEAIKEAALSCALQEVNRHLEAEYRPGHTSAMTPGSLEDWPIQQQSILFDLFGDTSELIGVRLTSSLMMNPTKSVSGIRFPTDTDFESCQLCPREDCPGRRAPYEPELYANRYH
ncbi:MAG: vitamin B12 dependent methionine synthase [Chloroflexi bacterium]|nr:vitamin B12 dependent methionine synthase [Chloroflexota bacterium]